MLSNTSYSKSETLGATGHQTQTWGGSCRTSVSADRRLGPEMPLPVRTKKAEEAAMLPPRTLPPPPPPLNPKLSRPWQPCADALRGERLSSSGHCVSCSHELQEATAPGPTRSGCSRAVE